MLAVWIAAYLHACRQPRLHSQGCILKHQAPWGLWGAVRVEGTSRYMEDLRVWLAAGHLHHTEWGEVCWSRIRGRIVLQHCHRPPLYQPMYVCDSASRDEGVCWAPAAKAALQRETWLHREEGKKILGHVHPAPTYHVPCDDV
jgi:hypothetical protein